jgi:rhodanese-related sulfurtransferase
MNEVPRVPASEIDTTMTPVLDVRTHAGKEQIRGAIRYDVKRLMAEEHLALPLDRDRRLVVYADDDRRAEELAEHLRAQGYRDAAILEGGFDAYRKAGLPVEGLTQEQPIPGQEGAGIHLE